MSYSVNEGISDTDKRLEFLKALKEAYPDAALQDDRWCADSLTVSDCDGFVLETEKSASDAFIYARLYRSIGGGRVYRTWGGRVMLQSFFDDMQKINPEFFALFLHKLKDGI